jgi:hypothetical protein
MGDGNLPISSIVTDYPSPWWIYAAGSAILAIIFMIIKSFSISRILLIESRLIARFCGDWAGAEYNEWGCPGTCEDYVAYNASSFWESYWGVSSLRVYQPSTPL